MSQKGKTSRCVVKVGKSNSRPLHFSQTDLDSSIIERPASREDSIRLEGRHEIVMQDVVEEE